MKIYEKNSRLESEIKHKTTSSFYVLTICMFLAINLYHCTEFLAPQATEEVLILNSPLDSLTTNQEIITFWWEENDKAEAYRVQVISPDFNNPLYLFDTLVQHTQFQKSFPDNNYSWRIRIENADSESSWQSRSFTIDSTYTE